MSVSEGIKNNSMSMRLILREALILRNHKYFRGMHLINIVVSDKAILTLVQQVQLMDIRAILNRQEIGEGSLETAPTRFLLTLCILELKPSSMNNPTVNSWPIIRLLEREFSIPASKQVINVLFCICCICTCVLFVEFTTFTNMI